VSGGEAKKDDALLTGDPEEMAEQILAVLKKERLIESGDPQAQ
jgi:hypothetical protein